MMIWRQPYQELIKNQTNTTQHIAWMRYFVSHPKMFSTAFSISVGPNVCSANFPFSFIYKCIKFLKISIYDRKTDIVCSMALEAQRLKQSNLTTTNVFFIDFTLLYVRHIDRQNVKNEYAWCMTSTKKRHFICEQLSAHHHHYLRKLRRKTKCGTHLCANHKLHVSFHFSLLNNHQFVMICSIYYCSFSTMKLKK